MSLLPKSSTERARIFHFRATQSGSGYFHGICSDILDEEYEVTFIGRKIAHYSFEPDSTLPRIEVQSPGPLSVLKSDFRILITEITPPLWFFQASTTDPEAMAHPIDVDRLYYGAVGQFFKLEPIRRLIAQELYFDTLRPLVETPDLLVHEAELIDQWRSAEPERFGWVEQRANSRLQQFGFEHSNTPEEKDRRLLCLAAYRRLDAWLRHSDKSIFQRPSAYGGQLYWPLLLPGHNRPMKVGLDLGVDHNTHNTDPADETEFRRLAQEESVVRAIEHACFPLAGCDGIVQPAHWQSLRNRWRLAAPLRDYEEASEVSAFPEGIFLVAPPKGILSRLPESYLGEIDPLALAEAGLCPWWPEVTATFVTAHQSEFEPVASDVQVRSWIERVYLKKNPAISCGILFV